MLQHQLRDHGTLPGLGFLPAAERGQLYSEVDLRLHGGRFDSGFFLAAVGLPAVSVASTGRAGVVLGFHRPEGREERDVDSGGFGGFGGGEGEEDERENRRVFAEVCVRVARGRVGGHRGRLRHCLGRRAEEISGAGKDLNGNKLFCV